MHRLTLDNGNLVHTKLHEDVKLALHLTTAFKYIVTTSVITYYLITLLIIQE